MKEQILKQLQENARISIAELAARLQLKEKQVEEMIAELEDGNIIKGYQAIVNDNLVKSNAVRALIEVKVTPQRDGGFDKIAMRIAKFSEVNNLFLVSGDYDLLLEVKGDSLQHVAEFVSSKLSTIDGVISTATVFMLKKYKESGRIMDNDEEYERLKVSP